MKVIHITSAHPPFDVRIFHKECQTIKEAGHDVILIVTGKIQQTVNGVKVRSVPKPKNRFVRMTLTMFRIYRMSIAQQGDIYHFHDPELILLGLVLKLKGLRVIYDVHEDMPRQIMNKPWIKKPFRRLVSLLFEIFENLLSRRFDALATATPIIRDRFLAQKIRSIDINNYPILSELPEVKMDWSRKDHAVCYVGGIWPERGVIQMIEAIAKTSARLIMAGTVYEVGVERLQRINGWQQVDLKGQLDRVGVASVLASAKAGLVLLHPVINYMESQPVKLFEYMAAGIPVIASDFPVWRKIIDNAGCGILVDPMDTGAIARAIQWLLDHPTEAEKMGSSGRDAIKKYYNWNTEAKKLLNLYESVTTR